MSRARGWRKKHDPATRDTPATNGPTTTGCFRGDFNCQAARTVLEGATGAVMGGAASNGGGVAIIVGAVLGSMVGGSIRRATDKTDHPCLGRALVLARKNHRVVWTGANAVAYAVAPRKEKQRAPVPRVRHGTRFRQALGKIRAKACRDPDGTRSVT